MAAARTYQNGARVHLAATGAFDRRAGSATLTASMLAPILLVLMTCALLSSCFSLSSLAVFGTTGCIVAAMGGSASAALARDRHLGVPAAIVAACAMGAVLVVPASRADLYAFCNAVIWHVDDACDMFFELIAPGALGASTPLFAIPAGVLFGVAWWRLSRLHVTAPTLLIVLLSSALSLYLGLGSVFAVVLGIAGWLLHCRLVQLASARTTWRALLVNLGAAFAICSAVCGACSLLYTSSGAIAGLRTVIVSGVDRVRYGDEVLPQGDLSSAATLNAKSDSHLDITVHGVPADDLLLRGYVGTSFEDGSWSSIDHTSYTGEWNGIVSWLEGRGFTPVRQRSLYDALKAKERDAEYETYSIDVHADDADRRFAFVPYNSSAQDGSRSVIDADGSLKSVLWGDRGYSFEVDNVPATEVFDDTSWLAESDDVYVQSERVYGAFAQSAYTEVDKREAAAIERYIFNGDTWDASADTSTYAVISRVRTMLDTLASYTDSPAVPKADGTFTDWFLGEAREGNSAYFATVATLALRSQGFPARYVEGYRATAKAMSDAVKVGGDLRLDSSDLHAWCEVYIDGQGWTPVEVTPGFYNQALEADSVIDVSEAWSGGSQADALQTSSVMGDINDKQDHRDTDPSVTPLDVALGLLGGTVTATAIVALLVIGQHQVRIRSRRSRLSDDDQSVCVPELYRVLSLIMRESLPDFDPARPLDALDGFEQTFRGIDIREYRRVIELHQAYAFGGRELTPAELRAVRRLTERIHASMPEPAGAMARLRRYAVDVL